MTATLVPLKDRLRGRCCPCGTPPAAHLSSLLKHCPVGCRSGARKRTHPRGQHIAFFANRLLLARLRAVRTLPRKMHGTVVVVWGSRVRPASGRRKLYALFTSGTSFLLSLRSLILHFITHYHLIQVPISGI